MKILDGILKVREGERVYLRDDTYMICCPARSGSSMLVHLLRSHPDVLSHGEVLGKTVTGLSGKLAARTRKEPDLLKRANLLKDKRPLYFLYNVVLYPQGHKATGFKLKYDELDTRAYREILDFLREDEDLKIVFLDRENLLERYVSHLVAGLTGVTLVSGKAERPDIPTVKVDARDLEQSFKRELERKARFRQVFARHRTIETTYEGLVADPAGGMAPIYAFLGVAPHVPRTDTKKIVDQDLSRVVSNYAELKQRFASTPYAAFFTH
jgi:LPS sulfotransferase NodH